MKFKRQPPLSFSDLFTLQKYTNKSRDLNKKLYNNHIENRLPLEGLTNEEKEIHKTVKRLASKPLGVSGILYSGISYDPSKNDTFYSPSHMSTSHDINTGEFFARRSKNHDNHMMAIHIEPKDKGYHVGEDSTFDGESETILPSGTTLTHIKSEPYENDFGNKFILHHFKIKHQE